MPSRKPDQNEGAGGAVPSPEAGTQAVIVKRGDGGNSYVELSTVTGARIAQDDNAEHAAKAAACYTGKGKIPPPDVKHIYSRSGADGTQDTVYNAQTGAGIEYRTMPGMESTLTVSGLAGNSLTTTGKTAETEGKKLQGCIKPYVPQ